MICVLKMIPFEYKSFGVCRFKMVTTKYTVVVVRWRKKRNQVLCTCKFSYYECERSDFCHMPFDNWWNGIREMGKSFALHSNPYYIFVSAGFAHSFIFVCREILSIIYSLRVVLSAAHYKFNKSFFLKPKENMLIHCHNHKVWCTKWIIAYMNKSNNTQPNTYL